MIYPSAIQQGIKLNGTSVGRSDVRSPDTAIGVYSSMIIIKCGSGMGRKSHSDARMHVYVEMSYLSPLVMLCVRPIPRNTRNLFGVCMSRRENVCDGHAIWICLYLMRRRRWGRRVDRLCAMLEK